jgi:RNA polymerase sigma factor (sigma-70 family)
MARGFRKVLEHLQTAGGGPTDGQLVDRFVATRDEAAFAALLRRHGPMVLGVCRRVLKDPHDADDAFQAAFLVLARKAASVLKRDSVGSWLYQVAYRAALAARAANARRRSVEKQVQEMPDPEVAPAEAHDWRPLLDRELSRLAEKYQAAVVLCDLEGRTRKEAARLLGVSEGTLSSRLATARRTLARRLARYGLALSGGALASALSAEVSARVPAALATSTARAAAGQAAAPASAVVLMQGVMKDMLIQKLKVVAGALAVVAALGAGGLVYQGAAPEAARAAPPDRPLSEVESLRKENELLRLNLLVVLEKVRAQENELRDLRAKQPGASTGTGTMGMGPMMPGPTGGSPGGVSETRGPSMGPGGMMPPGGMAPTGGAPGGVSGPRGPSMAPGGMMPPGGMQPTSPRQGPPGDLAGPLNLPPKPGGAPRKGADRDPLQEAEDALKALREARDPDGKRRAKEALDRALKKLNEQPQQEGPEDSFLRPTP